jgi:hypothetical protein
MKKFGLTALLCAAVLGMCSAASAENPELIKVGTPILITAYGQSQDANFVNLLAKRKKVPTKYDLHVFNKDVDWSQYKTMFIVLGGSGKGLGAAGLDIPGEVQRCDELLKGARDAGVKVVALHVGGSDRRGPNSEPFLHYAGEADFAIVRSDGNADGYFTKLCAEKNVPLYLIEKTNELSTIIPEMTK